MFRLSTNSFNINIFTQNKHDYELALKNSGYKDKFVYKTTEETLDVRNRRSYRERKTLWLTQPYNMALANKLRKEFFRLSKKNFPPSSNLYKIFNQNYVKLSYCFMTNVANVMSDTKNLRNKQRIQQT